MIECNGLGTKYTVVVQYIVISNMTYTVYDDIESVSVPDTDWIRIQSGQRIKLLSAVHFFSNFLS